MLPLPLFLCRLFRLPFIPLWPFIVYTSFLIISSFSTLSTIVKRKCSLVLSKNRRCQRVLCVIWVSSYRPTSYQYLSISQGWATLFTSRCDGESTGSFICICLPPAVPGGPSVSSASATLNTSLNYLSKSLDQDVLLYTMLFFFPPCTHCRLSPLSSSHRARSHLPSVGLTTHTHGLSPLSHREKQS